MKKIGGLILMIMALWMNVIDHNASATEVSIESFHNINMTSINGETLPLSDLKGKAVLVVNVASKCGFTSQYKDLQSLYDKYRDDGLVILGVPANNFGNQEPGSNSQIQAFCSATYGVSFPMTEKVSVRGDDQHPLYTFLTSSGQERSLRGNVQWNFTKFLVNQDGEVVKRYSSMTNPMSKRVQADIENLLRRG